MFKASRGFKDILPEEFLAFNYVVKKAKHIANINNYKHINLPLLENVEVFKRSMGNTSDVVNKEMFLLEKKGDELLSLRPEFTASVVRCFIENNLNQKLPLKLFTYGPLFRYERPQKGRYRQFNQINFEHFGEKSSLVDAQIILTAHSILKALGIEQKTVLEINCLGSLETREKYKEVLVKYLSTYKQKLSPDSQNRLEKNPLRILDSKDEKDAEITKNAPILLDFLSEEESNYFTQIQTLLTPFLSFKVNPKLVRGLDYYNDIVFEFKSQIEESGAKSAIIAGGRYDGLIKLMGGDNTPAIGFAGGIERILILLNNNFEKPKQNLIAVFAFSQNNNQKLLMLSQNLKEKGLAVEILSKSNVKKNFEQANKINASFAVILEDDDTLTIKNMQNQTQTKVDYKSGVLGDEVFRAFSI